MKQYVKDIMTANPVTLSENASCVEAAKAMHQGKIGAILVCRDTDGELCGIVTDRDIVVRAVAKGCDPNTTTLGEICSASLTTLAPNENADEAVRRMEKQAVRRMPVVDHGKAVGIVSLGDLAIDRDPRSALGQISAASPNN
jgi:CBS domain-containing protein